jgi:Predicted aminoglycoside phosphotransferase
MDAAAFAIDDLRRWLDQNVDGQSAPIVLERISGGASNLTYRVRRGEQSFALRHPTSHRNDSTADTLRREATLLDALRRSAIPHAAMIGNDLAGSAIGVPFILTEWIDGFAPRAPLPEGVTGPAAAQALAWELTDTLALIGNEDYLALGLDGFGKPEGFLERQVSRWLSQLDRARFRELDGLDELCSTLRQSPPTTQRTSLIHGDYQFINVMFWHSAPPRLAAVIDWETATIGDPLLDLGWMLAGWQETGEAPTHANYMDWTGLPTRAAVTQRYAEATGLDVSDINFYIALALFKLTAIMEGWYFQYVNGRSRVPGHAALETMVPQMISRALGFAGSRGKLKTAPDTCASSECITGRTAVS